MSEFIRFDLLKEKPKTNVYTVTNIKSDIILGVIQWYGSWRQYCFFPTPDTIFNRDCMRYIIDFIQKLMEKRKK